MKSKTRSIKMHRVLVVAALAVGLMVAVPAALAQDEVVDFDSGTGGGTPTYKEKVEDGEVVVKAKTGNVDIGNYDGDADNELQGGTYKFKVAGGKSFTVRRVDVVTLAGTSKFTSSDGEKETLSGTGTYHFPGEGWTNITSFKWSNTDPSVIDNFKIVVLEEEEEEPVIPDCGRSPYKPWPDQPGDYKYERQFWQPCRNVSGDENETLYHNLYLPQAIEAGLGQ